MQSQRPMLRQQQQLRMTPQLYQAIKIMALPLQELRVTIEEELERNPALEVLEDRTEMSLDDAERRSQEEQDYFDDVSDPGYLRSKIGDTREDAQRKFIEGVLTRSENLPEHLLWQLRLQPISEEEFEIGELLIRNLDENGFHRDAPETLVAPEKLRVMNRIKEMIQSFEPVGTCTSGYRESLLVQVRLHPEPCPGAAEVVDRYLELLEREKHKEIARALKIPVEQVTAIREFLRELDPMPGRRFSNEQPRYVIPDLMVKLQDGEFAIFLNDDDIPVLTVNPFYSNLSEGKAKSAERSVKKFASSGVQEARWFIRSIRQRNETLLKTCKAIVEFQREFFRKGPKYLVPLALKNIAEEIGVHEATVSRVTNGKYVQTEWGIFELKYFFSSSVPGSSPGGTRFSKEGVKEMIREIIQAEGQEAPLTDQKIGELLAEKGVKIARRTIAKYRKELDIMSSHHR
ncbi:MAG: RNA polymerase factor sigma-54 [Spirochaetales bacterium]|nr:RNA polymerase factor sigma-54 [Spirochaetales bacterium]